MSNHGPESDDRLTAGKPDPRDKRWQELTARTADLEDRISATEAGSDWLDRVRHIGRPT